jgi:hypothetical protein
VSSSTGSSCRNCFLPGSPTARSRCSVIAARSSTICHVYLLRCRQSQPKAMDGRAALAGGLGKTGERPLLETGRRQEPSPGLRLRVEQRRLCRLYVHVDDLERTWRRSRPKRTKKSRLSRAGPFGTSGKLNHGTRLSVEMTLTVVIQDVHCCRGYSWYVLLSIRPHSH